MMCESGGLAINQAGIAGRFDPIASRNRDPGTNILVVEDDCSIQQAIAAYLDQHRMHAVAVCRRREFDQKFGACEPDLILLDLGLDQGDGLDLLRDIRAASDVPIIVITGRRCDEIDRVVGLELGADDYVTKPFDLRELLARIRAVLRRRAIGRKAPPRDAAAGCIRFGKWQLDRRSRRLSDADGAPVPLTKSEYALLNAFLDAPNRPLTREHLQQATRVHEDVFDRSIDVQVLRLRRKLETNPSEPRVILTERGVGYRFAMRVEPM
jgi:DNA-binding response OmpR family regulator